MIPGFILIILGVLLAVATLGLVHQITLFGNTCFYIGEMNAQSQCIEPVIYYGALGAAAVLVLVGVILMVRPKAGTPTA